MVAIMEVLSFLLFVQTLLLTSAVRPDAPEVHTERERAKQRDEAPLTIVTAYIEFPSKHSTNDYREWMRGVLSYAGPIVCFVDSKNIAFIKSARQGKPSQFIPTELADLAANKYRGKLHHELGWYYNSSLQNSMSLDDYSVLQLEKVNFLKQAVALNAFGSSYYMWLDAGFLRNGQQIPPTWPDLGKLKVMDDGILLFSLSHNTCFPEEMPRMYTYDDPPHGVMTMGGFIGCHREHVHTLFDIFSGKLDAMVREGKEWAGMEQFVLSHIACENPNLFQVFEAGRDPFVDNNEWFYAVPYFMPWQARMSYYVRDLVYKALHKLPWFMAVCLLAFAVRLFGAGRFVIPKWAAQAEGDGGA